MRLGMTALTKGFYDDAVSGILTIQDAVRYLEKEAKIRSLHEKLEKFSHGRDLRRTLIEGLLENDPGREKETVERRVRGWLSSKSKICSIKKQDAIELCFILRLSIEEADQLITMIGEESLHYRDPDEIVYIFALQHGMSYREAAALYGRMREKMLNVRESKEVPEDSFTSVVRAEVSALETEKELAVYLEQSVSRLGRYHNWAYREFVRQMEALKKVRPENALADMGISDKKRCTVRSIIKEYLFGDNVLYAKEKVRKKDAFVFTKIQESVSANWPDETTLSKMRSRKTDVTRKVLILLFLATYEEGEHEDEEELTGEAAFEEIYGCLDEMLSLCGFATLDPRAPFDWLILYCICVGDMFDIEIRMREIFKEMFGERPKEEKG